jgi:stage II sporulation protein R
MKLRFIMSLVIGVLTVLLVVSMGQLTASADTATQAYVPDNLIRLHVVANSDSVADQIVKYAVRDAILRATSELFQDLHDVSEARITIQSNLKVIEDIADKVIAEHGKHYSAYATTGVYPFPTRRYGNVTLPAGDYEAVKIMLGKGRGENWWCVLFPPLCFADIVSSEKNPVVGFPLLADQVVEKVSNADEDSGVNSEASDGWMVKTKSSLNFIQLLTTPLSYLFNLTMP